MTDSLAYLSKHFRDVHFGGNWTCVNLNDTLQNINWIQATTPVYNLNTIAMLVFHVNYYVVAITDVLTGKPLTSQDKFSFDLKPITSEEEWQHLIQKMLQDAKNLAILIENLNPSYLDLEFTDPKYGTYYRNLLGIIEHTHYHLGQISILKKIVIAKEIRGKDQSA
ncbi:DUF1572 domain-containing protein [Sphingobacterium spiritivorum]|uniref:DUF1572 domain-containing protein n=1 Tax=Sphingobacterium spiritivorum TaxID=258 RepID=UPI003DA60ECE